MRRPVLLVLLLWSLVSGAQVRVAARAGLQLTTTHWKGVGGFVPRANVGIQLEVPLKNNWFIYSGLHYSGKGARSGRTYLSNRRDSLVVHLNYIELPLYFAHQSGDETTDRSWTVGGGPYIGYGFLGSEKWKGGRPLPTYHLHKKETGSYRRIEYGFGFFSQRNFNERWSLRADLSSSLFSIRTAYRSKERNLVGGFSVLYHFN
jgi:hypothetical protein